MRVSKHQRWLAGIAVLLSTGCQTVDNRSAWTGPSPEETELSDESRQFADVLTYYSLGVIHETHREFDLALDNYLKAASLDPYNEDLHYRIARGLVRLDRHEEAVRLISDLAERRPKSDQSKIWLALVYQDADRPADAKAVYEGLLESGTKDYIPYVDLASIYLRENNKEAAEQTLIAGTKKAEQRLELFKILGQYYTEGLPTVVDGPADEDRLNKAIRAFSEAVKLDENDVGSINQLGALYVLDGNLKKALQKFQIIEDLNPGSLQIKQQIALQIVETIGDLDQSIATLEASADDDPKNANVHYYLGELYQQADQPEKAIAAFTRAAEQVTDDPVPYIRLSLLTLEPDPGQAVKVLRDGLEKMPDDIRLTEMLAYSALANDEVDASLELFAKVDEAKPAEEQSGSFHFNYALAMYRSSDTTGAAGRLNEAIHHSLTYLERFMRQMLEDEDVDLSVPISVLQQVNARYETEPTVYRYLGFLYSYDQQFDKAVEACKTTLKLAEESVRRDLLLDDQFYFTYAAALERSGHYDMAAENFLKVLEQNSEHSNAHNYLAYMWAERGEHLEEALEHVNKALALEPDSAAFIDTLGWIYFKQGKYDDALREIKRAADLLPEDSTIVDHLGDVHHMLGNPTEAIDSWKKAFVMNPEDEKLKTKLIDHSIELEPLLAEAEEWKAHLETAAQEPAADDRPLEPDLPATESAMKNNKVLTNDDILPEHFEPVTETGLKPAPITEPDVLLDAPNQIHEDAPNAAPAVDKSRELSPIVNPEPVEEDHPTPTQPVPNGNSDSPGQQEKKAPAKAEPLPEPEQSGVE